MKYKVIIDWTGTEEAEYGDPITLHKSPLDERFFKTKEESKAFIYGFELGNGFMSEPTLKMEEEGSNEDILSGRDEAMDRYNKKLLDKLKTLNTKGR